jgi:ATP-dependent Clp protease ATP-binding subunit ClpB
VELQINGVQKMLAENGVTLQMSREAIDLLAEVGYDPEFGARPVKRALQRYLLNELAKELLGGGIDRSKPIVVERRGEELSFRN